MTAWLILGTTLLIAAVIAALGLYEFFVYRWLRDNLQWRDDET